MPTTPLDRLMFAQGGLCFFCKQLLPKAEASVEHLFASSNGGSNKDENCVACCKSVNALLGSMSLKEKFQVVLNQKGQFKCPNVGGAAARATSLRASTPPKAPASTKSKADNFNMVVANLIQRGNSRPRTLKTLTTTVASLFPKGIAEAEVTALIQQLQSTGKVSISENKFSYAL
jgi:hypothetical protein